MGRCSSRICSISSVWMRTRGRTIGVVTGGSSFRELAARARERCAAGESGQHDEREQYESGAPGAGVAGRVRLLGELEDQHRNVRDLAERVQVEVVVEDAVED